MAHKRKMTEPLEPKRPNYLVITREEAERNIAVQINEGRQLLELPIATEKDLERAKAEYSAWNSFNRELLRKLFNSPDVSDEYSSSGSIGTTVPFSLMGIGPSIGQQVEDFYNRIQRRIDSLESICKRLSLYEGQTQPLPRINTRQEPDIDNKVFIVHGQDETIKQTTARFLEKLGIEPIILHEHPNLGRTILEKFEAYSSVSYAVVLLTPDDVGGLASEQPKLSPRARQNVIFELGYFIGKLNRKKVCALYQKGVELPSDYDGTIYIPLDEAGAWKFLLAKELKAAGFDIDLNKAV